MIEAPGKIALTMHGTEKNIQLPKEAQKQSNYDQGIQLEKHQQTDD